MNPTQPIYDKTSGGFNYIQSNWGGNGNNPVEAAKTILAQQGINYLDIDGSLKLNICKNLYTKIILSDVSSEYRGYNFVPSTNTTVIHGSGRSTASQSLDQYDQDNLEWFGNYTQSIGKHSFILMGGYSYEQNVASGFNAANEGFPSDVLTYNNLGSGSYNLVQGINNVGSYKNSSKLISFFGRLNYDYDQKYYVTASLRREGSTKFGLSHKWGSFPAASIAWRITQEKFMQSFSWLNELKLRADYGITGNQDFGDYLSQNTYGGFGYYPYDGVTYQDWGPTQNANYDLHWETAINFNAGIDFEVLNSKITGSVDYFRRTNKDLLGWYSVPNPPNLVQQTYANVGSMRNSGIEVQLNAKAIQNTQFRYNISFNCATDNNVFLSFSNNLFQGQNYVDVVSMAAPGSPGTIQRLQAGKRIGSFYMLKSAGVDKNGELLVYNKNNEVVPASSATFDDRRFVGNGLPKFTANLDNHFDYKQWGLDIFLRGVFGYKIFNTNAFYMGTPATQLGANVLTCAYNSNSKYSKLTNNASYGILSDYFLEPGDFIKIDHVTLGYTVPIKNKDVHSMKIYVTANNLKTFTKFTGGDPESTNINGLYPGVNSSLSYYPSTMQLMFGLIVNFE
ncbi:TonB-linked SusC/RagA family outer membrane protein [Microbacter margulisiae]|uniref:TonB-linked SusC/RagA family outer membrane protein n=2 Tax=Microbacter margulisiae TaxID=1350067 RepID=A0A7W5DP69_9PORP|nr:TonB-dependent receptor [Microbacter margulisiae]MBB3186539.1 TonB-linked SusC/RagA family outer membrane protein [Microbacter margulisiae]